MSPCFTFVGGCDHGDGAAGGGDAVQVPAAVHRVDFQCGIVVLRSSNKSLSSKHNTMQRGWCQSARNKGQAYARLLSSVIWIESTNVLFSHTAPLDAGSRHGQSGRHDEEQRAEGVSKYPASKDETLRYKHLHTYMSQKIPGSGSPIHQVPADLQGQSRP